MSVKMIQQRLDSFYRCQTQQEERQAIREITQEVVLAALGRGDFFKSAAFQGGTCLRIFHGLNRFSEDLDFVLREPDPTFALEPYLLALDSELAAYGYRLEVVDRSKAEDVVKKAFIKDGSLGKLLAISYPDDSGPPAKVCVKIEVDTNPPTGSNEELQYLDFPFVSAVTAQDLPSLFAGKLHALLCRSYVKGRDWYDFIYYTSLGVIPNYSLLSSALNQLGSWQNQVPVVDKRWVVSALQERIVSIHWKQAAEDTRRFIKTHEQPSLDLWSRDLFQHQLGKWVKSTT